MTELKIIEIDPGHGGNDPGAVGDGVNESDIAITVSRLVHQKIQALNSIDDKPLKAFLTHDPDWPDDCAIWRDDKMPNFKRADKANNDNADIFVSIHCNASGNTDAKGHEVIKHPKSTGGLALATSINTAMASTLPEMRNRGVKNDCDLGRGKNFKLTVLHRTNMPAVIVEIGFISNKFDRDILRYQSGQERIASAIVQGICKYFGV